jgi:hypothetical protein
MPRQHLARLDEPEHRNNAKSVCDSTRRAKSAASSATQRHAMSGLAAQSRKQSIVARRLPPSRMQHETYTGVKMMCCTAVTLGRTSQVREANWGHRPDRPADEHVSLGTAVRVYPDTAEEIAGVIIEDFGDGAGQAVQIGGHHIVDAARRWAVRLNNGSLVFVDGHDISVG